MLLEMVCLWLIVENNKYQSASYFNSSNKVSATLLSTSQGVRDFFNLNDVNATLAAENAQLKRQIEQYNQSLYSINVRQNRDEDILKKYDFISAKVIKNSTRKFENYITVDKGLKHGIEPGMAVVDHRGVVGKVKTASNNYSVIISILHGNMLVSSKIKRTGDLCTTQWDGRDYQRAQVLYLPRHINLNVGDTVVTSGYNAIFPEGVPVGIVESYEIQEDALFHDVQIKLLPDLNSLSYVYLIKNNLLIEQDSIENVTIE